MLKIIIIITISIVYYFFNANVILCVSLLSIFYLFGVLYCAPILILKKKNRLCSNCISIFNDCQKKPDPFFPDIIISIQYIYTDCCNDACVI